MIRFRQSLRFCMRDSMQQKLKMSGLISFIPEAKPTKEGQTLGDNKCLSNPNPTGLQDFFPSLVVIIRSTCSRRELSWLLSHRFEPLGRNCVRLTRKTNDGNIKVDCHNLWCRFNRWSGRLGSKYTGPYRAFPSENG